MSGTFAISTYASHVFKQSNANFDANISAIIMGILQNVAIYVSSLLIDSWGRRILFGLSSCLSALALVFFATFSYLNYNGLDMSTVFWLPVFSVSLFSFVNCAGMRPLAFVYVAEVLPDDVSTVKGFFWRFLNLSTCWEITKKFFSRKQSPLLLRKSQFQVAPSSIIQSSCLLFYRFAASAQPFVCSLTFACKYCPLEHYRYWSKRSICTRSFGCMPESVLWVYCLPYSLWKRQKANVWIHRSHESALMLRLGTVEVWPEFYLKFLVRVKPTVTLSNFGFRSDLNCDLKVQVNLSPFQALSCSRNVLVMKR